MMNMCVRITTYIWLLILTRKSVSVSATVEEDHRTYPCCRDGSTLELPIHPKCEQSWTKGDMPIAEYNSEPKGCQDPCMEISSGKITLSKCVNLTLTVVCSNGENRTLQEKRIHYCAVKENICLQQHSTETLLTAARSRNLYIQCGILGGIFSALLLVVLLVFCRRRLEEAQAPCTV